MHISSILYSIVFLVLNWLSNLEFRLPKKEDQVARIGVMGGGFRGFGQCPKENVFFPLTPSLMSKHHINFGIQYDFKIVHVEMLCSGQSFRYLLFRWSVHCLLSIKGHCWMVQCNIFGSVTYNNSFCKLYIGIFKYKEIWIMRSPIHMWMCLTCWDYPWAIFTSY